MHPCPAARAIAVAIVAVLLALAAAKLLKPPLRPLWARVAQNGWLMYMTRGCSHCIQQLHYLQILGYPGRVVCDPHNSHSVHSSQVSLELIGRGEAPKCGEIRAYPTWYNVHTKERRVGVQTPPALEKMANQRR